MTDQYYATGRRKEATAKVWIQGGEGTITVNKRDLGGYFGRKTAEMIVRQPLVLTETLKSFDITATVLGGGLSGFRSTACCPRRGWDGPCGAITGFTIAQSILTTDKNPKRFPFKSSSSRTGAGPGMEFNQ